MRVRAAASSAWTKRDKRSAWPAALASMTKTITESAPAALAKKPTPIMAASRKQRNAPRPSPKGDAILVSARDNMTDARKRRSDPPARPSGNAEKLIFMVKTYRSGDRRVTFERVFEMTRSGKESFTALPPQTQTCHGCSRRSATTGLCQPRAICGFPADIRAKMDGVAWPLQNSYFLDRLVEAKRHALGELVAGRDRYPQEAL